MCSLLWMNTNQNRKQQDYNEGPWQVACLRIMSYFSKLVICIPTILLPLAFELFSKLFWKGMGYSGWKFCMNVWRRGVESFFFFEEWVVVGVGGIQRWMGMGVSWKWRSPILICGLFYTQCKWTLFHFNTM